MRMRIIIQMCVILATGATQHRLRSGAMRAREKEQYHTLKKLKGALPSIQKYLYVYFQSVPPFTCIRMSKIASVIALASRNRVSRLVPLITKGISSSSLLRSALIVFIGPAPIVSCMQAFKYLFTDIQKTAMTIRDPTNHSVCLCSWRPNIFKLMQP